MSTATRTQIIDLVKLRSEGLNPALICAIIEQESGFNPWAIRYEPLFFSHYIQPLLNDGKVHSMTEATARATSWGLMQLMGQCARELGYTEPPGMLLEVDTNLFWGMRHWRHKLSVANGDVERALLLWNGGGNPNYPHEVLARLGKFS
jgi:soluble lytic murein transglycosylase-like protein